MKHPNQAEYGFAIEVIKGLRTHANAKRVAAPTPLEEQFYYGNVKAYDKTLETLELAGESKLQEEVYAKSENPTR